MRTQKTGVSLVEALVAIAFLMVILGPLINLFSQSVAGTILNRDEMLANDYAADLIAVARTLPYHDLPVVERLNLNYMVADNYAEKPLEEGFNRYMSVIEFTDVPNSVFQYKVIIVEIEWDSSGITRSIKMPAITKKVRG